MKSTDVEIQAEDCAWHPNDKCILTGEPAQLVQITLRRMVLVLAVWSGEALPLTIPLARQRSFALAQYFRMLRPYFAIFFSFTFVLNLLPAMPGEQGYMVAIRIVVMVLCFLAPWYAMGRLLEKMEPIRLMRLSRDRKTAVIRFSDPDAATRAREALQAASNSLLG